MKSADRPLLRISCFRFVNLAATAIPWTLMCPVLMVVPYVTAGPREGGVVRPGVLPWGILFGEDWVPELGRRVVVDLGKMPLGVEGP